MTTPAISIVEAMRDPELFEAWFTGETWDGWRAVLKAAYCLPMAEAETEFFRTIADRDPPTKPVRELVVHRRKAWGQGFGRQRDRRAFSGAV